MKEELEKEFKELETRAFNAIILEIKKNCDKNHWNYSSERFCSLKDHYGNDVNDVVQEASELYDLINWYEERVKKLDQISYGTGKFTPERLNQISVSDTIRKNTRLLIIDDNTHDYGRIASIGLSEKHDHSHLAIATMLSQNKNKMPIKNINLLACNLIDSPFLKEPIPDNRYSLENNTYVITNPYKELNDTPYPTTSKKERKKGTHLTPKKKKRK